MSTKKTETSAAVEEKKSKTDIETRMEAGKVEVMKVVGGIPGAEKLAELIERGKKKGNLSAAELMDVLEDMDLESEQMDKIYDTLENLGIDTVGETTSPSCPTTWSPPLRPSRSCLRKRSWTPTPWWTPSAPTTRCGCI